MDYIGGNDAFGEDQLGSGSQNLSDHTLGGDAAIIVKMQYRSRWANCVTSHCGKTASLTSALGSAAVTWPLVARAQQLTMPMVGYLSPRSESGPCTVYCGHSKSGLTWDRGGRS